MNFPSNGVYKKMLYIMSDITEQQFTEYERVRQSGVTNMFDLKRVSRLSGLKREVILVIQKNYGALAVKFPQVLSTNLLRS